MEGRDEVRRRTFAELYDEVAVYAAAMKKMGIEKGDRVVGRSTPLYIIISFTV